METTGRQRLVFLLCTQTRKNKQIHVYDCEHTQIEK